jgi:hypothetical protein
MSIDERPHSSAQPTRTRHYHSLPRIYPEGALEVNFSGVPLEGFIGNWGFPRAPLPSRSRSARGWRWSSSSGPACGLVNVGVPSTVCWSTPIKIEPGVSSVMASTGIRWCFLPSPMNPLVTTSTKCSFLLSSTCRSRRKSRLLRSKPYKNQRVVVRMSLMTAHYWNASLRNIAEGPAPTSVPLRPRALLDCHTWVRSPSSSNRERPL